MSQWGATIDLDTGTSDVTHIACVVVRCWMCVLISDQTGELRVLLGLCVRVLCVFRMTSVWVFRLTDEPNRPKDDETFDL